MFACSVAGVRLHNAKIEIKHKDYYKNVKFQDEKCSKCAGGAGLPRQESVSVEACTV